MRVFTPDASGARLECPIGANHVRIAMMRLSIALETLSDTGPSIARPGSRRDRAVIVQQHPRTARGAYRPLSAAFLAQLAASALRLPQACARRRRPADEASAEYSRAGDMPVLRGSVLNRSV